MYGEYIYAIILLGILVSMLLVHRHEIAKDPHSALIAKNHLSTTAAFWCYFTAYVFLTIFWVLVWLENGIESHGIHLGLAHSLIHVPRIMCGWLASSCLLMSAIAYASGKRLHLRGMISVAAKAAVAMLAWAVLWEIPGHAHSAMWTALLISPDLALATFAMVLLGWAFYVRWSGSFPAVYLALTGVYAVLQLPLHLALDLDEFLQKVGGRPPLLSTEFLETLNVSYPLVAGCHLLLAYFFLSLLTRQAAPGVDLEQPRLLLGGSRATARWMGPRLGGAWVTRAFDLCYAAGLAVVAAAVWDLLKPYVLKFLAG